MITWVAARSDFPVYGEVVAFKLPGEGAAQAQTPEPVAEAAELCG